MNTEYDSNLDVIDPELEQQLFARHTEVKTFADLETQRGTPIPSLFNMFYKFIQNPSSVSVETFKRMVDTDDTIGSGVDFLTTALAARLGTYQHKSDEITQWVNQQLENIDGGFFNLIKEMLSASWSGFAVAEKVWANTEHGFVPKKVVHLPPSTLLFETDRTGEITDDGILQYQRNYNPGLAGGAGYLFGFSSITGFNQSAYRPDPLAKLGDLPFPLRTANSFGYMAIRLPKMKCMHYAFDAQGKFGNPYGRSLLRRCYKYYVMKDAFLQMLSVALDRKGTPLTIIFADPHATMIDPEKSGGQSAKGRDVGIRADEAARRAFKNIHNDTTIILPGKKGGTYDTDFVPQDSNSEAFIASLEFCNKSIMRALLLPSLIFTGGDGAGSYALGQEHAKTFDKVCDGINAGLSQVLLQQLVKEMLAYNFPRSAWEKDGLGSFTKRQLTQEELDKELAAIEKGVNMGAIDMNDIADLNKIRGKMGFEDREAPIQKPMSGLQDLFGGEGLPPAPPGKEGEIDPEQKGELKPNPFEKKPNPFGGKNEK